MAIAAWKHIERSHGYQRKKLFLKRLIGRELRLQRDLAIHTIKEGGWWFHPDVLGGDSIVYSLGIGKDVDFDLALIRRFGLHVHAFDPTPSTVKWLSDRDLPENFHFHPWAVSAEDGVLNLYPRIRRDGTRSAEMYTLMPGGAAPADAIVVPAFCLTSILGELGHDRIDLLKMDIEGAEYEVLDSMLESGVKPAQLLVEFHHRFSGIGLGETAATIARLRESEYRIFAISETGREISFLQAGEHRP